MSALTRVGHPPQARFAAAPGHVDNRNEKYYLLRSSLRTIDS